MGLRAPRSLLPAVLAITLAGCPKVNDGDAGPSPSPDASANPNRPFEPTASPSSPAPAPAAASLDLNGPECKALRDAVAALATAARGCTSTATACRRCVAGYVHHCGIFVGDETSDATREYLATLEKVVDGGCMLPTTATPPCDPETEGKCGADGLCAPAWCNVPKAP